MCYLLRHWEINPSFVITTSTNFHVYQWEAGPWRDYSNVCSISPICTIHHIEDLLWNDCGYSQLWHQTFWQAFEYNRTHLSFKAYWNLDTVSSLIIWANVLTGKKTTQNTRDINCWGHITFDRLFLKFSWWPWILCWKNKPAQRKTCDSHPS